MHWSNDRAHTVAHLQLQVFHSFYCQHSNLLQLKLAKKHRRLGPKKKKQRVNIHASSDNIIEHANDPTN